MNVGPPLDPETLKNDPHTTCPQNGSRRLTGGLDRYEHVAMASPEQSRMVSERRLKDAVIRSGLVREDSRWTVLPGGRTSLVWRVRSGKDDLVCRYRVENRGNPLFPSLPRDEIRCLELLRQTGCVPGVRGTVSIGNGIVLICEYVPGKPWSLPSSTAARDRSLAEVAQLLGRIHDVHPRPDLEDRPAGSDELRQHGRSILSMCAGEDAKRLGHLEPRCNSVDCRRRTLVHGDVVPGNLIRSNDRLAVIDWQCPGIGDPADDIACFLSPGMQMTNGGVVMDASLIEAFMEAYPCQDTIDRYRNLRPLFHWRMAAYCLWRTQFPGPGYPEYQEAMEAEIAAID